MNKNIILNAAVGVFLGGVFLFLGYLIIYLIITTKIQTQSNSNDIQTITNFINASIKQAPAK